MKVEKNYPKMYYIVSLSLDLTSKRSSLLSIWTLLNCQLVWTVFEAVLQSKTRSAKLSNAS